MTSKRNIVVAYCNVVIFVNGSLKETFNISSYMYGEKSVFISITLEPIRFCIHMIKNFHKHIFSYPCLFIYLLHFLPHLCHLTLKIDIVGTSLSVCYCCSEVQRWSCIGCFHNKVFVVVSCLHENKQGKPYLSNIYGDKKKDAFPFNVLE